MPISRMNPPTLHANPAYAQVVVADHVKQVVYVGGQNAIHPDGTVIGPDLAAQSELALGNVLRALEAAGCTSHDVVQLKVYAVAGHDLREAFAVAQRVWTGPPSALTVLVVAGLANPQFLVEIEATAVITSR
jgi:2-iminobutanoate/2-iminopropanoate deaminase